MRLVAAAIVVLAGVLVPRTASADIVRLTTGATAAVAVRLQRRGNISPARGRRLSGRPDMGIAIDHVVEFVVDDEEIVGRMSGRRVHAQSGRSYHVVFNPPKQEGLDDLTGEALI